MIGVAKILLGLLAVGGVGTGAVIALTPEPSADTAIVKHHVDGDTLDVDLKGSTERIRLLNIDTPETKDPNVAVQCLGPEAATYLATLIPVGTEVTLEYDRVRTDRFGRTLAGVFTPDHVLVNAEVARQGFADIVIIDGNDRFYPPVEAARAEASAGGRGLYSLAIACTLPGQVQTVSTAVADLATPDPAAAASADLDTAAAKAAASVTLATALERLFAGERVGHAWAAIPIDEQQRLATRVAAARESAQRAEAAARSAAAVARDREAAETAERDRQAREAETQRAREAERRRAPEAREQAAREAEAGRKQQEANAAARQRKATVPKSQSAPANPYPGYTGPRCYAPGGKTWKPC